MAKTCSFFGHRKIEETQELKDRLKRVILYLIEEENVRNFLFGSNSDFYTLCHRIVSELKEMYPDIVRKKYICRSETCSLVSQKELWAKIYKSINVNEVLWMEEEVEHDTKWTSGKGQYVERNQAMIDDSDFCVFYYNALYQPALRKTSKRDVVPYQPKSGTEVALDYAIRKKRNGKLINFFNVFREED